jgi:abhydrolase domain-containing protein 17
MKRWLVGELSWIRLIKSIAFIYGCVAVFVFFYADHLIFQPPPASYQDSQNILKLKTVDGDTISAIYLPNSAAKYTLLYVHGNGEDIGQILPVLLDLQHMGFAVFSYDYRGYGTSQGQPSERNAYRDIDAAYEYLTKTLNVKPQQLIVYGRSVGGGSAIDLATRQPVAGAIVESTFITAFRVLTRIPLFPFDKFTNLDKLDRINCPLLILHGTEDEVVPFAHGQQLFAAAKEPKQFVWVEGAGHNDLRDVAGDRYPQELQQFTATLGDRSP